MADLPTGQRGQMLAAGLAVLTLSLLWLGLVTPVLQWYDNRSGQLELMRGRAAREIALIATLPELKEAAKAAAATPSTAMLTGASDAIAGATLQEQVQSMATSANAQLTSIETLPAEQVGLYRRIGVHVELSAQLDVITHLLSAVEEAQPRMLVDDIRLTATPIGLQTVQLPLDAAFTVYGFRIGTAKDDSP
jgi:general secretion pathway protein M